MAQKASSKANSLTKQNAELLSENVRLKQELSLHSPRARNRHSILSRTAAVLLLVFSVIVLVIGNILFWVGDTVINSSNFQSSTSPIIKDKNVQQAIALYVNNTIYQNIDAQKEIEGALPPKADFLAPQLANQLKAASLATFEKVLATPAFQDRWNNFLAIQHEQLITSISKYNGGGEVSLNAIYNQLSASLENTKLSFLANKTLPPKAGSIVIVNATWLPLAHTVVTNINTWRYLALLALVLSLFGAIMLSAHRRRTIYIFSFIAAGGLIATLIAQWLFSQRIADSVDPQYAKGVSSALSIFFHPFVVQSLLVMLALLIIGLTTWISGNSQGASTIKEKIRYIFSGKLHDILFLKTIDSVYGCKHTSSYLNGLLLSYWQ